MKQDELYLLFFSLWSSTVQ